MPQRWSSFQSKSSLVDHGPASLRSNAVEILEHYIRAADPYPRTLDIIKIDGNELFIGDIRFHLNEISHIYVVGAGKATQSVALAVEEILKDRISDGLVILKRGESHYLDHIRIKAASHPIPDQASWDGAREIVRLSELAIQGDLVIATFTGGSSALMVWPAPGISLQDKQLLNKLLLECGASIQEINAVRKHVSLVKGGRLGLKIFPAELVNLTVSDVIGDPLDCITDLTVPDTSTYQDAWATMDKYSLWDKIPRNICEHLKQGTDIETPKVYTNSYHSFITVTSREVCLSTADKCREMGFETHILTNSMDGESRLAAKDFINTAYQIARKSDPLKRLAFLSSGETTVTLDGSTGEGGRNQEFSLSAAHMIADQKGVVVACLATDGTDGPTDACGGLVDSETVHRARNAGIDPEDALSFHVSMKALQATGDLMISGPTGTNVNDVALLLIDKGDNNLANGIGIR
jgi:hydroxypyruvate reductase/glycerate 2-kinase